MTPKRINPLRIALLPIGAASIVTNFVLLVFLLTGSEGAFKYIAGVVCVSFLCVVGAEFADSRKSK